MTSLWWVISLATIISRRQQIRAIGGETQVPCYFILGDSLADPGNNNFLVTTAKANYLPYGDDFPLGATGRFCNGRTTPDVIGQLLGFTNYIPPYATASGPTILKGVNYASGGAGIRNETGRNLGDRITMDEQLRDHGNLVQQIINILGDKDLAYNHLQKCIYYVDIGSNDYINNYFMPTLYPTSSIYTPEQFADALIQQYSQQIRTLYKYGARKVALTGLGAIGCTPNALALYSSDGSSCIESMDAAVQLFNIQLQCLVDELNTDLTDANFIYLNAYDVSDELVNPSYGIKVFNIACCGGGKNNGEITCLPLQIPCQNRSAYYFWDRFHPSEAVNRIVGSRYYAAQSSSDAYPMDIRSLAALEPLEITKVVASANNVIT